MQKDTGIKLTKKQAGWLEHLRAWEASGESLAGYAAEHGLRRQSLYRWKSRLQALGEQSTHPNVRRGTSRAGRPQSRPADLGFIAARLAVDEDRPPSRGLRIRLRNGVVLEVDVSCTGVLAADLLSRLALLP